ncbi:MAG: T9SS type A sorting domain-containing protein [Bacteroidetes bacterium]|nr:T9SS type A sorting domain-containing protein [Bacteroidota bacterium]
MKRFDILIRSSMILLQIILFSNSCLSQGYNHNWLLGYDYSPNYIKARMTFSSTVDSIFAEQRKIPFQGFTQANISDANGNLLMSSNGAWIANSTGDTMLNGSFLGYDSYINAHTDGILITYANIIIPYPNNTTKYVLFHQSADYNGISYYSPAINYSIIDMTKDGGLGAVDSTQKYIVAIQDTMNGGIAACRHANGRDWWVVAQKHDTDTIYKILFTPTGIASITTQKLIVPKAVYSISQLTFSPDGKKFVYQTYIPYQPDSSYILTFDFDRCSGLFTTHNPVFVNRGYIWGLAFSPNSQYVYACTADKLYQLNLNTYNLDTIATYDGFNSPFTWCCPTTFFNCYLAANGKIYITSGNGVQHIHEMNFPDSAGIACDFQQHVIPTPMGAIHRGSVPNHPNYYLGCDTTQTTCPCLITGINDVKQHDFKFSISPNPSNGNFKITYLLPQNSKGIFEVFDITGKKVFSYSLPQWSTLQNFDLSFLSNGVYAVKITSGNFSITKKLIVYKE